jgi:hypothetical protein
MKTYFGFATDGDIIGVFEYTDWNDYLGFGEGNEFDGQKIVFTTTLFEAEEHSVALDLVHKKIAHWEKKVAEAVEKNYWVEGMRGADI